MPESSRRFLLRLAMLLLGGALIGALYGNPERGLLVACALALAWQVRNLLAFAKALRTRDFATFGEGDGIWDQMYSQFAYMDERAARRKRMYRRLLKEIRRSTDAMPDAAVILDRNNDILMCNRAATKIAGLKPKKDRGQRIDNFLRDPKLIKLLRSGDYSREIEIPAPLNEDGWLNCRIVPYGGEQKLLILRDVTERRRLSKMRRDFVANASHELRSPLTVITGYLDSLADDSRVPDDWRQPVDRMREQAQRMNQIVAELLELSRLESAGPARADEVVDVASLLSAAKETYENREFGPKFELAVTSTTRLRGQIGEIESVVTNLVTNALRHTPPDGTVTLGWHSDAGGAELIVRDTGEGIAPEHLPRLTERFFRVDRGRARGDGGVGLGLAIVKHVLSRHDASLEIDSEPGKGSEFRCRFPAARLVADPPIPLAGESAAS